MRGKIASLAARSVALIERNREREREKNPGGSEELEASLTYDADGGTNSAA
jgi:hypothetical protein